MAASLPFPDVPLSTPQFGSGHVVIIPNQIPLISLACVYCTCIGGPIEITVGNKKDSPTFHFRPESMVYNPLNRTVSGHVVIPIEAVSPLLFAVSVTCTNNSAVEGEARLFVGWDELDIDKQIVLAERRKIPAGDATAFHVVVQGS